MKFSVDSPPSQREFILNMEAKITDPEFLGDTIGLLRQGQSYEPLPAYELVKTELIEKISQMSLKDLQKSGRAEFKIGSSNEGSMLVLRVKKIVAESFTVPESSVGKILEGSEDLWK